MHLKCVQGQRTDTVEKDKEKLGRISSEPRAKPQTHIDLSQGRWADRESFRVRSAMIKAVIPKNK